MTAIEERLGARSRMDDMADEQNYERFEVVSADSSLTFFATSTLFPVYGRATELNGFVEAAFNADGTLRTTPQPKMHVDLKVETLRTGNELQDREMWNLIDSKRFPKIAADLREVSASTVSGRFAAAGHITFAGLARRYEGNLMQQRDGKRVTIVGDLDVDVRDFGLKPMNLLVLSVAPLVRVHLHLVADKEG